MPKPRSRRADVEIYDHKYSIVLSSTLVEADVHKLAEEVDSRMRSIADRTGIADSLKVAILTSLHLALENAELKLRADKTESVVATKSREWTRALEQVLKNAG